MSIRKSASALLLAAAVEGVLPLAAPALAQSDATVTYQGRLDRQGEPYSGTPDVRFTLWTASSGGEQVPGAAVNTLLGVDIVDGLLTAPIDFGAQAFGSQPRFVEVQVRTPAWDGTGSEPAFTTLDPRQAITGAPYSVSTRGITVDETGAVGIITTVPGRPLQVGDSGRESVGVIRLAHRNGFQFRRWDFGIGDRDLFGHPDNFGFRDLSGNTIMVLESTGQGGNVGIGVLNPSAKLDVGGGVRTIDNQGYTFSAPGDQDSGLFSFGNGEVSLLADGEAVVTASSTGLTLNFGDGSQQTTAHRPIVVRPFRFLTAGESICRSTFPVRSPAWRSS
ncbi:MAG: hypothetical protein RIB58_03385 [Phycisphaerales bacterium]